MKKNLIHAVVLLTTVFISFIFPKSALSQYDFQIIALLFVFLYIKKKFFPVREHSYRGEAHLLESVIFTLTILIIVNTTSGALSPYFFLLYFLLFALGLILEPSISFIISLSLVIFFLIQAPEGIGLNYYIQIFSLAFLTPFSVLMADQYVENKKLRQEVSQMEHVIEELEEKI